MNENQADDVISVLYIEDDEDDFILTQQMLFDRVAQRFQITWARSYAEGEAKLQSEQYDAVLVDYDLGKLDSGIELVRQYSPTYPAPFILYTGRGTYEVDLEAMQAGATLYLTKGNFDSLTLKRFIRYAIERRQAEQDLKKAHEHAVWLARFPDENPNPVARVSLDGKVLYCNRISADAAVWSFELGEQVPPSFAKIIAEVSHRKIQIEREVQLGDRFYAVTFMPFIDDGYINLYGKDMTGRIEAEKSMRESEELFAKAFEGNPNAMVISQIEDGRIESVNSAFEKLFGYERQEVIGRRSTSLGMFSRVDDRQLVYQRLMADGHLKDFEIDIRHRSGEIRHVDLSAVIIQLHGEPAMLTVINDITERKRAEEALAATAVQLNESERRFRTMADGTPVIIWVTDADNKIEFINRAYSAFFGTTLEQVRSGNWEILVHPEEQEKYVGAFLTAASQRVPFRGQARVRRHDGEWRWIDTHGQPRFSDQGEYMGMAGSSLDITENKLAETVREHLLREIQLQNQFLQQLFENSPLAIAVLHGPDHRFVLVNSAQRRLFPTVPEFVGRTVTEVWPDTQADTTAALNHVFETGEPFYATDVPRTVDLGRGLEERFYSFSYTPMYTPDARIKGILVLSMETTEQVRNRQMLEQAYVDLATERNRLSAVLQSLPVGVSIQDSNGGVIERNKAYDELWGEEAPRPDSVEGYTEFQAWWVDTGKPVMPEEWGSAIAVKTGQTVTDQFLRIRRFDGRHIFVLNNAAPVLDATGRITGSVVAILDVTKVVEAENNLIQSQDRFRVALQSVPLMVYNCDTELRYTWIYRPLAGFEVDQVLGKRDDELIPAQAAAELMAVKQQTLDSGLGGVFEVSVPAGGADRYYLLTTDPLRDRQGNITGLTCSAIDITEQKRMQAEQQEQSIRVEVQRRLLNQRELERSTLAGELHDRPIQILSGALFQIQTVRDDIPDPVVRQECDRIRNQVKLAIRELREMMKDLRPPVLLHFSFARMLQSDAIDYRERFPGVEILLDLEDDGDRMSQTVRLALFRIYQAGVSNIIRHADANKVWVKFKIEGDQFCFELRDNGAGFTMSDDLAQMMNEGQFGLVSMKERAEAIGGEVTITSQPLQGTAVQVRGPLQWGET